MCFVALIDSIPPDRLDRVFHSVLLGRKFFGPPASHFSSDQHHAPPVLRLIPIGTLVFRRIACLEKAFPGMPQAYGRSLSSWMFCGLAVLASERAVKYSVRPETLHQPALPRA
jgi:hypothetical protein